MEKTKKIKISLALIYGVIISLILWAFFSKFSLNDLTSYEFIKNNKDYLTVIKESNYLLVLVLFLIFTIIWVFFVGFATPIFLLGGFIFGKWIGTLIGMTPQMFVGTSLGSGIERIIYRNTGAPTFLELFTSAEIYIPVLGFIFLVILGFFLKRFFYNN